MSVPVEGLTPTPPAVPPSRRPAQTRTPSTAPGTAVQGLFVVVGFVIAAFFPFLAIYLKGRDLDETQIGFVIASMAVARLIFLPLWGHFADTRLGRLTVLQVGTLGAALAGLAMNRVNGMFGIAAAMFILSIFMVSVGPNVDAIALVHLGEDNMSDYGRIRAWESLSYAAGCLVFGAILQAAGITWAMPIYAASSILVLSWSLTLKRDKPEDVPEHGKLGAVGAVFKEAPRFWGFLVAVLIMWVGFNAAWNFLAIKIESGGGGPFLVGIGTAMGGLVEVAVMRWSSRLHRRLGLRSVYALGCLVYAAGFLLWGLIANPTIVAMLTVFEGAGFALLFTTSVVVVGRLLPESLYSSGNSITGMVAFGIGPILGAGIGGYVYQTAGATTLYVGASVLALLGGIVAWFALSTPQLDEPLDEPVG
ncbi:MAG: transporter, family, 3-phenylpropionic acid transporter [Actinomycetota bacterium]|jgi:PPP family 3-phenylpropionic acid transporter|nr:transporter, family, 3-phenylpropionic acid transporter [Actinomycetota bacterium]